MRHVVTGIGCLGALVIRCRRARRRTLPRLGLIGLALLLTTAMLLPQRTPVALATTLGYAKAFVGTTASSSAVGNGIAVGGTGIAYVAGNFIGTVDFDPGTGTNTHTSFGSSQDGYAATPDEPSLAGQVRQFTGDGADTATAIAVDGNGNSYVTGTINDTSTGNRNAAYVGKRNAGGNLLTAFVVFQGTGNASGTGIAVDASGDNVYVTGFFSGTIDFNPDPGPGFEINRTSAGSNDVFVAKLTSSGDILFARQIGGTGSDIGRGIAVDGDDHVFVTGEFSGTADLDPNPFTTFNLTSAGLNDAFVVRMNGGLDLVWADRLGGTGDDVGNAITAAANGDVYVTGTFQGTADFDPNISSIITLTSAGSNDAFAVKLSVNGIFIWAKQFGGTNAESGSGIALDSDGNVYLTGLFAGTTDFDPGPGTANLTSAGGSVDVFAVKLDANGAFVWVERFGGPTEDVGTGIALDPSRNVYLTGRFTGTVDFDPGPGTSNLTSNASAPANNGAFIVKLVQAGPPVNGLPSTQQIAVDGTPLVFSAAGGNRISIADPDNGSSPLWVTLSITSGTLSLGSTTGLTFSQGDGTADASMMFSGTLDAINNALGVLTFAPVPSGPFGATLLIVSQDQLGPSGGQSDADSLAITIGRRPVATNDSFTVNNGSTLSVAAVDGLLKNDTDADTAQGGLLASVLTHPAGGTLILQPNGGFTYTPAKSFVGTDSFTYRVTDNLGLVSNTATASITVNAVSCGPRPTVVVKTQVVGGALQTTVSAATNAQAPNNRLVSIRFETLGATANAQVTLDGQVVASNETLTLPAGATTQTFTVRRTQPGAPTMVRFTVTDTCGVWPSFVGGGAGAGF